MKLSNVQIFILRLAVAGLFLYTGIMKIKAGWLVSPDNLIGSLASYKEHAAGFQLTYIERVAIPLAGLWSKLITIGETAVGISMVLGLLVRFSSLVGIFMLLNFHLINGNLLSLDFFSTPWAGLLIAVLLVLFLSCGGRWAGVDALAAKSRPKSVLW